MGTFNSEIKISDKPIMAAQNIEIPNVSKKECGNCKSMNVICVFNESAGSIIGWYSDIEFYCNDCGKYTLYSDDYDS